MKKKYLFVLLVFAITITFCGTATAEEQNTTQINQSDTNTQTTVNDQASPVQDNSIVDTSNTTNSTENTIQDNQSDTDPQNTVSDQATNSSTTQNTQNSASNDITTTSYATNEDPVVITFDDGFESTYTIAFPIMEQYGIKGTVYVNPAWVGGPGYLTLAQLTALHNAGWTIANHSWDHPALPSLTTSQITNELLTTINWLNNNGFQDGAYHLAYPYGQYNNNVLQVANQLGIKTARTVNWGTITPDGYTVPYGQPLDYLQLPIILIRSDTTRNDWQSELDNSIARKGTAIFLIHDIVTGNPITLEDITVTTFRTIIEYIAQTGVKTETISQWYNEMTNAALVANFTATPTSGTVPLTVQFTDQSTGSPNSYAWDFNNDGTVDSTQKNPSYTYTTPGTYTVKLTVTNSTGSNSLTRTSYITVNNAATVANFTAAPTSGTAPLTVQFTDQSTGSGLTYQWDFNNDGTVDSTAKNPSYTYSNLGTYSVKLTVTNSAGGTDDEIKTNYITVTNTISNLLTTNQQGVETNLTGFDNYLSTLTRDTSIKYAGTASAKAVASSGFSQLLFAGNSIAVTAGKDYIANAYVRADVGTLGSQTITILYDWYSSSGHSAYTYQWVNLSDIGENVWHYIELAAKAPAGATSVYMSIALGNAVSGDTYWYDNGGLREITNTAPVANFTATPVTGTAPLQVQFTDQSTGSPNSYAWDFNNDGTVDSTQKNPSYTYTTPGTYTVKLTVTNSVGSNSLTRTSYITVNNAATVANFTAVPTSGTAPLTVQFTDQSTGSGLTYQWDFNNDGTIDSTSQNPSYSYNSAGTYRVKLTVTNSTGSNSLTKTNYITVTNTGPDLVISNLQVPSNPQVGTTYAVNFTVTNSGSANAGSFVVNLMDGTTTIGQQTISSLAAGQSTTVTLNWIPTVTGLRTINATADVNNAITETNETNNNISQQVTVVTQGSSNLLTTNQQGVETDLTGFDNYLSTLTRDTSIKYAGTASAKAVASSGFSQLMFAGNSIAVTAGTNYIANAYVRADVGTLGSQTITILYDWYGSSGHLAYNYQMINVSSFGENIWHYLELQATAPAGATSVYMSIALSNAASGDTYWYDSGVLQAV